MFKLFFSLKFSLTKSYKNNDSSYLENMKSLARRFKCTMKQMVAQTLVIYLSNKVLILHGKNNVSAFEK